MAPKKAKQQQQQEQQQQPEQPEEARPAQAKDDDVDSDDDSGSDDEQEHHGPDCNQQGAGSPGGAAGKKKKKKKNKKKKKGSASAAGVDAASSSSAPSTSQPKIDKAEADKRFNAALQSVKSNDEMWIKLGASGVQDAKLKKLLDQLKSNISVTSLDLSQNQLTDEGAQAIAAILGTNGAAELIELDLRENNFSPQGLNTLDGLKKIRKQLEIKTGSIKPPEPPAPAGGKKEARPGTPGSKDLREVARGPMFRKYFQTADDEEDDPGLADSVPDPSVDPDELWGKIDSLAAGGTANIPALLPQLQQLALEVQRELSTLGGPNSDAMDGQRPHIKACLDHLHTLEELAGLMPRDVTVQYSGSAQPAVGSHRVWVAEVMAQLLSAGNNVIDRLLAASKLPHRLLALALQRPLCSTLHTRALRLLKAMLASRVEGLYTPLFLSGWGADIQLDGGAGRVPPLPELLAQHGTAAVGVVSGQRSPRMGLVLEASKALAACCDESNDTHNSLVARGLGACAPWVKFTEEVCWEEETDPSARGPFHVLCAEQEGDLGGPRAVRTVMNGNTELADLAGGGFMTGPEILALLHGMTLPA